MRSVLGLPLEEAVALLTLDGYRVETVETRSKKGTGGTDNRVVRQQERDGTVQLLYAAFITTVQKQA